MLREDNIVAAKFAVWAIQERRNPYITGQLLNRQPVLADTLVSGYTLCHCESDAHGLRYHCAEH